MKRGFRRDRRAAVALMVGVMTPGLLGTLALTVDAGFWVVGQTRLQVAADAGAMGASFLLSSSTFKAMNAATQQTTANTVALAEANGAMTKLMGTLATPVTVAVASDYSSVTVTLYSQSSSYFGNVFKIAAPLLRATAKAGLKPAGACVLALATTGNAIMVDNAGTIAAASCNVDSKANIYLNSGTISATSIVAAGTVTQSNSGSNSMTPTTPTQNAAVPADPYAAQTAPAPGACTTHPDYTAYSSTTYIVDPGTWCGNTTFGGNNSSITFKSGVYIISNGDLTFNNALIKSTTNVTFVLSGATPGNFTWTNNSGTTMAISAPISGATAGIAIWQACNSSGSQKGSFQGGSSSSTSTMNITGAIYEPCAAVDIGNYAQVAAPLNGSMTFVSQSLYVHGSAALRTTGSSAAGANGAVAVLMQ